MTDVLNRAQQSALQSGCVMSQHRVTCYDLTPSLAHTPEEEGLLELGAGEGNIPEEQAGSAVNDFFGSQLLHVLKLHYLS